MSDFKKMIDLLESAEKGPVQVEATTYSRRFDEERDVWVVEDNTGMEQGYYPTESEAKRMQGLFESDDDEETEEVTYESFWDAFEVDEDFVIHESNETYCVLGDKTNFHYGTHVSEDIAEKHIESLKDFK